MNEFQIVYVLTNPAMPGLIKIGFATAGDANQRIAQLYTSGVPVPFKLEFSCRVKNAAEVERALHLAFGPNRLNPKREFFSIQPEQAIAILKLLHTEDTTNEVRAQPTDLEKTDIEAGEQLRRRRPNLNFEEMGIPLGAKLDFRYNDLHVTVAGPKKVDLMGEITSLTAATRELLMLEYSVNPGPYWTYNGKSVSELYEETYGSVES